MNYEWIFIVIFMLGVCIVSSMEASDAQAQDELYCEMVSLWEADYHLKPQDRKGHPNYKDVECN